MQRNAKPNLRNYTERGESIVELYSKGEKSAKAPGLMDLVEYLQELCQTVFSKPQQSMRQQLRVSKPVVVCDRLLDRIVVRVVDSEKTHPDSNKKIPIAYMLLYLEQETEHFGMACERCAYGCND